MEHKLRQPQILYITDIWIKVPHSRHMKTILNMREAVQEEATHTTLTPNETYNENANVTIKGTIARDNRYV